MNVPMITDCCGVPVSTGHREDCEFRRGTWTATMPGAPLCVSCRRVFVFTTAGQLRHPLPWCPGLLEAMSFPVSDACLYGELSASDPASLACDYGGLIETHWCADWEPDTQAILDGCESVADLRQVWERLELGGHVDGFGGAEYHHALSHLRHKLREGKSHA